MLFIYAFHAAFYALFLLRKLGDRSPALAAAAGSDAPSAPHARALIAIHMAAFWVLYFGLGQALLSGHGSRLLFSPQEVLGAAVIVVAGALLASALRVFRSWRLLARIEEGHQLCTAGPFRFVRHPIYVSMDLLALGTFLWVPSPIVLVGAILVVLAGDLRGRGEEKLLAAVFGDVYRGYCRRTARTIPGLY
jgi:protein-S-isoprenylcysteine O-methyltransferase Ste14